MAFTIKKQLYTLTILFLILVVGISQVIISEERHEQWTIKYGIVYKDDEEKQKGFLIFKKNVEYIESFNAAGDKSYKLGINHLTDLTVEELK
ncbi:hypothetical protein HN873_062723, partial [Arachis hypogaea]